MAITANNTTLTFNDATTQTTSAVTSIGVGTGISSTGGKTPTLTNTGVTSVSGAGTVSVSASTGAITITGTGGSGTVTSVATGNGLSGGTITSTGTLVVACPTFNSVGSYCFVRIRLAQPTGGTNYSAGAGFSQLESAAIEEGGPNFQSQDNLSGTWKWMAATFSYGANITGLACRVS
jgi:trimeric autotransporter adhesin